MCGLQALTIKRELRSQTVIKQNHVFTKPFDRHPVFKIRKCHTKSYRKSAIRTIQRKLNPHHDKINALNRKA